MLVKVSLVLFVLFVGVASSVKTTCPGGRQQCPDDSTCCEMNSSSSYGCCPLPNAVCCSDKFHCCPANTRCDDESRSCLASNGTVFAATKKVRKSKTQIIVPEITSIDNIENYRKAIYGSVICPDEVSECPEANTCCELEDGSYGCCPMEDKMLNSPSIMCLSQAKKRLANSIERKEDEILTNSDNKAERGEVKYRRSARNANGRGKPELANDIRDYLQPKICVGSKYQATLPDLQSQPPARDSTHRAEQVWGLCDVPINEKYANDYMSAAIAQYEYAVDDALTLLFKSNFDITTACSKMEANTNRHIFKPFTQKERAIFEDSMRKKKERITYLKGALSKTRTSAEVIEYYYMSKKLSCKHPKTGVPCGCMSMNHSLAENMVLRNECLNCVQKLYQLTDVKESLEGKLCLVCKAVYDNTHKLRIPELPFTSESPLHGQNQKSSGDTEMIPDEETTSYTFENFYTEGPSNDGMETDLFAALDNDAILAKEVEDVMNKILDLVIEETNGGNLVLGKKATKIENVSGYSITDLSLTEVSGIPGGSEQQSVPDIVEETTGKSEPINPLTVKIEVEHNKMDTLPLSNPSSIQLYANDDSQDRETNLKDSQENSATDFKAMYGTPINPKSLHHMIAEENSQSPSTSDEALKNGVADADEEMKVETRITKENGDVFLEVRNNDSFNETLSNKQSYGYVVDTKPDLQIAQVCDNIFVGSQDVAGDLSILQKHHITNIINVSYDVMSFFPEQFRYLKISIFDREDEQLGQYIEQVNEYIFNELDINKKAKFFFHCSAGISRAPSFVAAYLILCQNYTFADALHSIKKARTNAKPNASFIEQLTKLKPGSRNT
uniref:GRANULINS domain-containing protein n=1 Tax=Rhabditophanes sp. KR3021 TaxID=114890 RepID=A0AC35TP61_9BILA